MVDRVSPARSVASQVRSFAVVILAAATLVFADSSLISAAEITVSPTTIAIDRPESTQQVLVSTIEGAGRVDVTRKVVYQVIDPQVARAGSDGLVHPLRDGKTELIIRHGDVERRVPLEVTGFSAPPPVSFAHEVQPILTKGRCNSGGCHGKAEGQNGFKLSLFGFDATADYDAIVRAARGRRVMLASPERSLLLTKGSAQMPHGGGLKLDPDGPGYRRVLRWLAAGAPATVIEERPIERIEVEPAVVDLTAGGQQQLRVTAIDSAGTKRCATVEADFVSNAPHIALPDERGLVRTTDAPGEAAILVRYQGHVAVARIVVPRPGVAVPRVAENNFIDRHIWDKLTQLGLPASDVAEDGMFLRRVYLDVIGTLPTAAEAREFLDDPSPDKRSRVINQLLKRPEYADYWAMKWANLLRADKIKITPQATVGMTRWLRKQFASNRPYDEMVREILTAQGPIQSESPAALFKSLDQPELAGRSISQLFLGVRIECAQCHHHPSERWSQDDYAGWAGFFTGIATKRLPEGADAIVAKAGTDAKHPRSGVVVPARVLGGEPADFSQVRDRRQVMADWVVHPDNPFFARAIANRLWAHYFGRGLVEPIDDQRATNPPVNEPLLAALAAHLKDVKYDLHAFTRTLLESRAYQLSSQATDANRDDRQNFSHAQPKALPAEVLLDAVCQTTGVPEKFNGWPLGVRSIEVWDNRMPSYFFRIFGRPARATVCECERSNEPSISQALHLLNSPEI
ncbi:MAG TPA: DUF1549 domain-containing protein, partial [Pirellulaceae bacterium]|nr:DUF1549 domain-containing protein [Pirellulaceae bacterium]